MAKELFSTSSWLLAIPPEILLHILSFLDIPDLSILAQVSPELAHYVEDPVLHHLRLHVVAPSRLSHSLFGQSPSGMPLRPTVADLVRRNIMRGLGIERRWRAGMYFHSQHMVSQYETSRRLQRTHAGNIIESTLRKRSARSLLNVYSAQVLPDESTSSVVSTSLIATMRRLKWSIQRDRLAKFVKARSDVMRDGGAGAWFESKGRVITSRESERVRLAVCPGIGQIVRFYEGLGH